MNKFAIKTFSLGLLIIIILVARLWIFPSEQPELVNSPRLLIGDAVLTVEIADEPNEWAQGLSGKESLCDECGTLFLFPESRKQSFWMREMNFALDMIFIDEEKVVEIFEDVPFPEDGKDGREIKVETELPTEWVLEVNSGWVERNGVEVGNEVSFE